MSEHCWDSLGDRPACDNQDIWLNAKKVLPPINHDSSCYVSIDVLVYSGERRMVAHYSPNDKAWYSTQGWCEELKEVTHWINLPEPPR